jgi:putative acetyltransferase
MKIRTSKAEDYKELADLFTETVHSICSADYKPEQLALWAPKKIDYEKWENRFQDKNPFLVIENDKIAGFAEFENDGHIDCF